jgi:predicted DsbA family dithiol-disulfide isomerase
VSPELMDRSPELEVGIESDRGGGLRIQFTFDYVDPGSFVASELMTRWLEEADATVSVDWRPLELRTPSDAPIDPLEPAWEALCASMDAIAKGEGLPIGRPGRIPWTRKAHELAFHAREKGRFEGVHRALFRAHFSGSQDIGRIDHLVGLGQDQGLEGAETRTVLGVDRFLPRVESARMEAISQGIRGVPTIQIGSQRLEGLADATSLRRFLSEGLGHR